MKGRVVPDRRELSLPSKVVVGLEVLATYARIRWAFRDGNAKAAMPRIRSSRVSPRRAPGSLEQRHLTGLRLGHIVGRTLGPLPYDSRCLFSSLTLSALLHRRGIDATLVIAVRPQPFAAHAWVEHDARPLLEPGGQDFERIAEL